MKLTARQVETAKPKDKPYKLADGGGLYLLVNPNGKRYWRLKYRSLGKEKLLAIGVYPSFGFAENTDDLFVGKTLLHGDVLMWLMKTLLTSGCTNQRGAGHSFKSLEHDESFFLFF